MNLKLALIPVLLLGASQLQATELSVGVEIPKLNVAEYHKPYVALWVEDSNNQVVANLAVLYDQKMRNNEGEKWLKDMRQWWRKTGRSLAMPVDGVSGATKGPGQHEFQFVGGQAPLGTLTAGEYKLRVEAAREVGGRELLDIPFTLPVSQATTLSAQGSSELGAITLTVKP